MTRIPYFGLILITIGLWSCQSKNNSDTLVINLDDARKNKVEVKYSEVVKRVEYIQPETSDQSIVLAGYEAEEGFQVLAE